MAYSADTFVADEQPTTAKWNKLWSNDASFNDGTGIADNAIIARHLSNDIVGAAEMIYGQMARRVGGSATDYNTVGTTSYDTSATNLLVQTGMSTITNGTGTNITFPVAYSAKPFTMVSMASALTANCYCRHKASNVTTTTINDIAVFDASGGSVNNEIVSWLAIGPA